jgi:type I restriction-modification system DNA methylase subunit
MPYRFAQDRYDYSDFAAGPVFYSLPGRPAFPVRLTSEIFQRCQAHLLRLGNAGPYSIYDPCCGSAYLLATLAYLHWPAIRHLAGSDVDPAVIPLAERNLSLTTLAGVETRIAQLAQWHDQFGKDSHAQALASAQRLRVQLLAHHADHPISSQVFVANALYLTNLQQQLASGAVDIVITDLPYGQRTSWDTAEALAFDPGWQLLDALREIVTPVSIIAITSTKQQKIAHDAYQRVEQFQIGKRHTRFFMLK